MDFIQNSYIYIYIYMCVCVCVSMIKQIKKNSLICIMCTYEVVFIWNGSG